MLPSVTKSRITFSQSTNSEAPVHPSTAAERFKLGDASLLVSGDGVLMDRFLQILADCRDDSISSLQVECRVHARSEAVAISFSYPGERRDLARWLDALPGGPDEKPAASIDGDTLVFD